MLEQFGEKCDVKQNDTLGRYVVARKDIRAGEVLLYDKPFLIAPQWDSNLICANCFRDSQTICNTCNIFPLCFECKNHCSFDCDFFAKIPDNQIQRNFLIENFTIYSPLKCLLLMEKNLLNDDDQNGGITKEFIKMESHLNARKHLTNDWNHFEENIVKPLIKSGISNFLKKSKILDSDLIQRICGIIDVNSFEIRGPNSGQTLRGLYVKAALLAHNCITNSMISVDEKYEMKILASVSIKADEIVYYNYTNPLMGTQQRQTYLKHGKYFDCLCCRCKDPTELGTFMSAIKCQKCPDKNGYYLKIENNWICDKCSDIMDTSEVKKLLNIANDETNEHENVRDLEISIEKFRKIFHPNHYILIDLKQNLASNLRTICDNPMYESGIAVYQRKMELCEDILDILKIVQPGISRLTGIALYEYFNSLVEIARRKMNILSKEEYLKELIKAESILRESASMLLYEPANTPEGILAKRILSELKSLRIAIKDMTK